MKEIFSKNSAAGILVIALVFVALAIWLGIVIGRSINETSPYSAVYLSTGDVYFGKLSWFPWPKLTDVWYLERVAGANGQSQLAILPLSGSFWKPRNEINLNPKQIIFWTRLEGSGDLAKLLQNPELQKGQSPVFPPDNFFPPQASGTPR